MIAYDPHRLSPRAAPDRFAPALLAYFFGRDRRHPLGWLLALTALVGLALIVTAWLPFAVAGIVAGSGAFEFADRHPVPSWVMPIAVAAGLVFAATILPSVLVAAGVLVGLSRGRGHHRSPLVALPTPPRRENEA